MIVCGIPLFFLEVSVGQYIGKGGMSVVGQLAPIFKGVGYSAITMVFLENVYYIIVVTWTLFYLFNTFMDFPNLPWSDCSKGSEFETLIIILTYLIFLSSLSQTVPGLTRSAGTQRTD